MKEQIYIVGAGAIGRSLAVFLRAQGRQVVLIRASEDDGSEENIALQVSLADGTLMSGSVLLSSFSRQTKFEGVVVLANKAFGNERIAEVLEGKINNSSIVVMQNGLNIEESFVKRNFPAVYRCVLFATSQTIGNESVRFKPVSPSPIGSVKGNDSQLPAIIALLDTPQFRFEAVGDIQPLIWKKVIANCVFNSICPLLEIDNGIFHRDETARLLATEVIDECVRIGKAVGVNLDAEEVLQTVLRISKSSDGQLISTLQDIRNNRPTEIDSLNFAISAIATQLNRPDLVTKTKLLGQLTKLKSQITSSLPTGRQARPFS
jgi:2-dehydropantoate 2-reductase